MHWLEYSASPSAPKHGQKFAGTGFRQVRVIREHIGSPRHKKSPPELNQGSRLVSVYPHISISRYGVSPEISHKASFAAGSCSSSGAFRYDRKLSNCTKRIPLSASGCFLITLLRTFRPIHNSVSVERDKPQNLSPGLGSRTHSMGTARSEFATLGRLNGRILLVD